MIRTFSRGLSGPGTEKARSFYLVVNRYFAVLGLGRRRADAPLRGDTNDRLDAIERRLDALEKATLPTVAYRGAPIEVTEEMRARLREMLDNEQRVERDRRL